MNLYRRYWRVAFRFIYVSCHDLSTYWYQMKSSAISTRTRNYWRWQSVCFKFKPSEYQPCEVYVFVEWVKSTLYVCPNVKRYLPRSTRINGRWRNEVFAVSYNGKPKWIRNETKTEMAVSWKPVYKNGGKPFIEICGLSGEVRRSGN